MPEPDDEPLTVADSDSGIDPRPFCRLRASLSERQDRLHIGYLSYDLARGIERLPSLAEADRDWPVLHLERCRRWLVIDHFTGRVEDHGGLWAELREAAGSGGGGVATEALSGDWHCQPPVSNLSEAAYVERVRRAKALIAAGDVFQVNLSQRYTAAYRGSPRAFYRRLCAASPAWYAAYLELPGGRVIASTSPELFLDCADGEVTTRPIKGTRPVASATATATASSTPWTDADPAIAELLHSVKDAAELNMIVDMLRNDLGRVCAYGSVRVAEPRHVETHPTVHQGVATIVGRLHDSREVVDLLLAAMPGGSITGAPKVRAMEIIESLEPCRRGPYCGAIGYIDPAGRRMQWSIAIRTALLTASTPGSGPGSGLGGAVADGRLDFSVGGGIVADSDPAAEYRETLDKAAAIRAAMGVCGGGSRVSP